MKAIIMAGGEGKRLKAISGDTPKPLVKLCGRPVMEHIILLLKKHGITDICCSLGYRPQEITDYFGDGSALGVRLCYRIEEKCLGTAGGVKNCEDFYGNEDFLVISGDCACDFDLGSFISAHEKHKPCVSIALYPHPEPLQYGLAVCDRDSCIRSFIEKPDWSHVVTNLVNTGIYIVSPEAMSFVPENTQYDFAKELFPELLSKDKTLLGTVLDGYWCDIGTPLSYYNCCADALTGRLKLELGEGFNLSAVDEACECKDCKDPHTDIQCRDRARLMGRLSEVFLCMGADYSDGIVLNGEDYMLKICPLPSRTAVRISANAHDAEIADELRISASQLVKELEKRLD